ncbi:MAG: transcription termination factor NusA [Patescibacteria group bacterium]|nr:transcription termination factor NusA [Patescibacteria group bacterium]MDD4610675.1 transcription termination factor NusA [Patescibacteria group bacterium]
MSELTNAIKQICEEKSLSYEAVIATIESALAAAYRKDFGERNQNIKVEFNPDTGTSHVFDIKTVTEDMPEEIMEDEIVPEEKNKAKKDLGKKVESKNEKGKNQEEPIVAYIAGDEASEEEVRRFNPRTEIQIKDAVLIGKYKVGDEIKTELPIPAEYGRMAAQTAKQVIIQRLREAERENIFSDFKDKEGEVVSGVIQRREGRVILIDLGKTAGILPPEEQIYGEKYNQGDRIKVYIKEVRFGSKGPEIILSRTSDEILKKIFYLEIPEIANGLVELKAVAREAGSRSKVAVWTDSENVDPIGSCVGQRGARIQTIISELGGEKVDIILYDEDPAKFITNALAPAKVVGIDANEEERRATVKVVVDQLSLAIGKGGQNARLAARLTGWKIDIIEGGSVKKAEGSEEEITETETVKEAKEEGETKEKDVKVKKEKKTKKAKSKKEEAEE